MCNQAFDLQEPIHLLILTPTKTNKLSHAYRI